jgi:MFS family permease
VSFVLLTIAAFGTFLLADARTFLVELIAALSIGFGTGGEVDVVPYLLSRYFGLRSLSTLYGLNWTVWGLAGAAGPVLMGRVFDATGPTNRRSSPSPPPRSPSPRSCSRCLRTDVQVRQPSQSGEPWSAN